VSTKPEEFDPELVPVFPVLNLQVTPEGGALVGGRALVVADGQDPTDAAIQAAAAEAQLLPGDHGAIRVRAVDAAGNVHPMVVRADGTAFDLTPPTPRVATRPTWWLPAAAFAIAVVLGAGVVTTVAVIRSDAAPAAPAGVSTPTPLVGAGANLPIPAPPGYAQQATWAVPVDPQVAPVPTADGDLLAKTTNGDLVLLDAATGRRLWSGNNGGDKLHTFVADGQSIAVSSTGQQLSLWALPDKESKATPGAPVDPVTVALPSQATVSYDGATPLVTLPDQTAALVTSAGLTRVDVPVGATALAATSTSVIAAGTDGFWYALTPDAQPAAKQLAAPAGTPGVLVRTIAAGGTHLAGVWDTGTPMQPAQRVVLYDLRTGRAVADEAGTPGVDLTQAAVIHQEGGSRLTLGAVLIDYGSAAVVVDLGAAFTPKTLTNGHVYGAIDRASSDVRITGHAATFSTMTETDPGKTPVEPVATTATTAYIAANKVEKYLLYAVPSLTGGNKP
jgi:hypothetical protein